MRVSEEKLRSVFDSSPDAITVTDLNGIVVDCNIAALKLHNVSKIEAVGRNSLELIGEEDRGIASTE